jgi:hypothetical protein
MTGVNTTFIAVTSPRNARSILSTEQAIPPRPELLLEAQ